MLYALEDIPGRNLDQAHEEHFLLFMNVNRIRIIVPLAWDLGIDERCKEQS